MSGIIAQNAGRHTGLIKAAGGGGAWNLISTFTSDGSDATASFTSGLDDTYDQYCFKFINIHPETDDTTFEWNASIDSGSNYNVAKTSTFFKAAHSESDSETIFGYVTGSDLAQGTGFQHLGIENGNDNDQSINGYLILYNPASTTFVKHFMSFADGNMQADYVYTSHGAGYVNTTSAVDAIQFKFNSDEIQGGTISLYGIT